MGNSSSKQPKQGLKVPSIILEENVVRHFLAPHLVEGRIPTPIEEGAFLAALEALTAVEPRMRHYSTSFRARSLIKACDEFHDRLYAVYYSTYDDSGGEGELQNSGSDDSIAIASAEPASPDTPAGAGNPQSAQSPASAMDPDPGSQSNTASPSTTTPSPTTGNSTSAINTSTSSALDINQPKEMGEKAVPDSADTDEQQDHVCAKVQSLESKVAKLERTVSLLAKMIERSRSIRQNLQKQNAHPTKDPKDDHVDSPKAPDTNAIMSTSPDLQQCLAEDKQAVASRAQQASSPIPPIIIPLSLLVTEPHPLLIELQATHGGVPVPVSAAHFTACIELARSIERVCPGTHAASVSPTKPDLDSRISRASPPPRSTGPPRRIVPLSDPPSHARRFSTPATPSKTKALVPALDKLPPPPKDTRKSAKTACEVAAKFMEDVYASTKAHPSPPTSKPDEMEQLLQRIKELEDEVRMLRSHMMIVDNEQKDQQERITELEDNVDQAHGGIDELQKRVASLISSRTEAASRAQSLPALESKLASLETSLATHMTSFDQFQVQISGQLSANRCSIDTLTADVDELYDKVHDENGNNPMEALAKVNEEFEAKVQGWVESKVSLDRRVSKLEQRDEDDDWVDADLKQPVDGDLKS